MSLVGLCGLLLFELFGTHEPGSDGIDLRLTDDEVLSGGFDHIDRELAELVDFDYLAIARLSANAPAIDRQDACASTEVDTGEGLADTGRPVAETDIAVAPASLAKFDEPSILKRLNEDRKFTTRCSSA